MLPWGCTDRCSIRGSIVPVVVGVSLCTNTYNSPAELLRWHSIYFSNEIHRLNSIVASSESNKKRKLFAEDKLTAIMKVEDEGNDHATNLSNPHGVRKEDMVIRLPDVDPMIFELFMKFVYMGFYPFEADAPQPVAYIGSSTPQRISRYTSVQATIPALKGTTSMPPVSASSMAPPSSPSPKISTMGPLGFNAIPYQSIPQSIHAWLLGSRISAFRFMNHAMVHIHSGMGEYFSLTPNLVHFVWQRTPQKSALRKLITDFLLVYWTESVPGRQCIDRRPALNQQWMNVFDAYPDLKSLFVLGLGGRRQMQPCEAYLVYPQMQTAAPVAVKGNDGFVNAMAQSKGAKEELEEKPKMELQDGAKEEMKKYPKGTVEVVEVGSKASNTSVIEVATEGVIRQEGADGGGEKK